MSKRDYQDVATERSIIGKCGYPLCINSLPSERPRKGRYRISLKEHKVYDLYETYLYCSTDCVVNSRAFGESLHEERCSVINSERLNEILRQFEALGSSSEEELGKNGDLGLSELKIQEKADASSEAVPMQEWIGPSNAIEGYVPRHDRKSSQSRNSKEGSKPIHSKSNGEESTFEEVDFTSTFITQDEYSISKLRSHQKVMDGNTESGGLKKKTSHKNEGKNVSIVNGKLSISEVSLGHVASAPSDNIMVADKRCDIGKEAHSRSEALKSSLKSSGSTPIRSKKGEEIIFNEMDFMGTIITQDEYSISKLPSQMKAMDSNRESLGLKKKMSHGNSEEKVSLVNDKLRISDVSLEPCESGSSKNIMEEDKRKFTGKKAQLRFAALKSSLKSSGSPKVTRSVTWADEKTDSESDRNLCKFRKSEDEKVATSGFAITDERDDYNSYRLASAEACAIGLRQAAEAVASGETEAPDAVSKAGLMLLPPPHDTDEVESEEIVKAIDPECAPVKLPRKSGISESDFFDSEDSWYDSPPEGFSLSLSTFATMFMALFGWTSSSSLAFIYGHDESHCDDFASINGREYPRKVVAPDGRSAEIKQTLASCLGWALPGLVSDFRLPTPMSSLEQGLGGLLDTMSFFDPLPAFRMKQWQVLVLLFIDALSVCRIPPAITPHLMNRWRLFQKVFDSAQISSEEYEVMKDLIIPLGRLPQFSMQSGG